MHRTRLTLCLFATSTLMLAGCDALGIESPAQEAARMEAEGKAIGSACRHAVRSVEDCFRSNPKAGKASVFDGWKEMDAYMRENEIVGMPFTPEPPAPPPPPAPPAEAEDESSDEESAPAKGKSKAAPEMEPGAKKTQKS
jgi:hypothetical protein